MVLCNHAVDVADGAAGLVATENDPDTGPGARSSRHSARHDAHTRAESTPSQRTPRSQSPGPQDHPVAGFRRIRVMPPQEEVQAIGEGGTAMADVHTAEGWKVPLRLPRMGSALRPATGPQARSPGAAGPMAAGAGAGGAVVRDSAAALQRQSAAAPGVVHGAEDGSAPSTATKPQWRSVVRRAGRPPDSGGPGYAGELLCPRRQAAPCR